LGKKDQKIRVLIGKMKLVIKFFLPRRDLGTIWRKKTHFGGFWHHLAQIIQKHQKSWQHLRLIYTRRAHPAKTKTHSGSFWVHHFIAFFKRLKNSSLQLWIYKYAKIP
jgi:hypothetical protein